MESLFLCWKHIRIIINELRNDIHIFERSIANEKKSYLFCLWINDKTIECMCSFGCQHKISWIFQILHIPISNVFFRFIYSFFNSNWIFDPFWHWQDWHTYPGMKYWLHLNTVLSTGKRWNEIIFVSVKSRSSSKHV